MSYHIPYTPSRLNPSFPLPLQFIPSQFPPVPQPFPSPPIIVGGGRFGKRKLSVIQGQGQGRGTMSMPTSPLRQSVNTEVWQGPHSASAYSSQPPENVNVHPAQAIPSFFSDRTISPPDHEYDHYHDLDHDHDEREGGEGEGDDVPPPRKKRAQVRVACTHCQKACKKCSNTRPCERCVKYGLPDCIDSMRKPRKTGVKRGPYKRRTSSLYQQDQYPLQPLTHTHTQIQHSQSQSAHQSQSNQAYPNHHHHQQQVQVHDPITQAFAAAFDKPTWINGRRQSINPTQIQTQTHAPINVQGPGHGVYGYAAPPPPPPIINFQNTFNHREAPRQKIPSISTAHITNPNTQIFKGDERRGSMSSIFPISLHTSSGQDPFSRTVSPLGFKFSLPTSNLSTTTTTGMDIDPPTRDDMEGIDHDYSMSITPPGVNVVDFAYPTQVHQNQDQRQGMVFHSAPTSPRGTRMETDINMDVGRASSAEPPPTTTFPSDRPPLPGFDQRQDLSMGVGMGMITPIPMPILGDRKPSLLTLMNSRPHSPSLPRPEQAQTQAHLSQSVQGQESPTLFDGLPLISNHHSYPENNERERRMSLFGSMQLSSLPNAGGVGRLSLSKGSEGIGLGLGLEHVS